MKVFFDNCTAPAMAGALNGFLCHVGHEALHIKDVPGLSRGRHSADDEWLSFLSQSKDDWIFVTGDGRISRNPLLRSALRSAGLHGFVLAPAYQKSPLNLVAAALILRWPDIDEICSRLKPPSLHQIPIGKHSKIAPLPF